MAPPQGAPPGAPPGAPLFGYAVGRAGHRQHPPQAAPAAEGRPGDWYPVPYGDLPPAGVGPASPAPRADYLQGRSESLSRGDWPGALLCVGVTVGAVYLAGVLLTLFYAVFAGGVPSQALVSMPAAGVATAFGASWQVTLGGRDLDGVFGPSGDLSYDVRAYPLLFSTLGVWLLAWLATRRFATGRSAATLLDRLTQAARIGLLLGCCCLVLALVSRQPIGTGRVNADYALAFIGGLVVGAITAAVAALRHDPTQAPPALRRLGTALAEPLVALRLAVPVIVVLGLLQLLAVTALGGVRDDLSAAGVDTTTSRSLAAALLIPFAPNSAWMLFGIVVGAPLEIHTGTSLGINHTTSLLDLTAASPWWWLAPFATLAVFFAAGILLALRSPSAYVARRRVGVWALVFGAVSFGLSYAGSAMLHLRSPFGNINATIGNAPVLVLVLSAAWAVLAGLGAVALVQRLTPQTRLRWARRVHAPGAGPSPGTDLSDPGGALA